MDIYNFEGPRPQVVLDECRVGYDSLNSGLLSKVLYRLPPLVPEIVVSEMDGPRPLGFLDYSVCCFVRSLRGRGVSSLLFAHQVEDEGRATRPFYCFASLLAE